MSIQSVAWALEQDLPQGPKLVLVALANHANHVDGYCWLKAETIGREASCSPRSVFRYVGALVRNGYVRKAPRKGDNGKQRANDYWILFRREPAEWDWGAQLDDDAPEGAETTPDDAAEPQSEERTEPQDVVVPSANLAHGESAAPTATSGTRQPVDKHALSRGPSATAGTRESIAEPSKPKSKESSAGARDAVHPPRAYIPPPPQPMGSIADKEAKQIFVYEHSRAYEAWAKHLATENRIRHWHLVTRAMIDGKWHSGWYFPSLFPPPPKESTAA